MYHTIKCKTKITTKIININMIVILTILLQHIIKYYKNTAICATC